jgi:hypothetical protein
MLGLVVRCLGWVALLRFRGQPLLLGDVRLIRIGDQRQEQSFGEPA